MPPVVVVENLSKSYVIGQRQLFKSLRESMVDWPRRFLSRPRSRSEVIWVLKNVSLTIDAGEVVAIIGRNGAGKSTLLKILSRITYPTSGTSRVHGRVASLLEVGTGFHDELTGRENVYLNGSILGLRERDVNARMDQIVEFAGVERFMDTPLKHYSSGMRLRLGFAVAAHLDPDILIIDEVLAVGDLPFQRKCFGVMERLRQSGRTVLLVSHNLTAVESLSPRTIWLDSGQVREDGPTRHVLRSYMATVFGGGSPRGGGLTFDNRDGQGDIRYTDLEFLDPARRPVELIRTGNPLVVRLHYRAEKPIPYPAFGLSILTTSGTLVAEVNTRHQGIAIPVIPPGDGHIEVEFDSLGLTPGRYVLTLSIKSLHDARQVYDELRYAVSPEVVGSGQVLNRGGIVLFPTTWSLPVHRG